MLSVRDYEAFRRGQFVVECVSMELCRQGSTNVEYRGAGEIRQGSDRQLTFVIYCVEAKRPSLVYGGEPPGQWLEPTDFYVLTAAAVSGQVWTARRVSPTIQLSFYAPGAIVRGGLRELSTLNAVPVIARGLVAYTPFGVDFPTNSVTTVATTVAGRETTALDRNVWSIGTSLGEFVVVSRTAGFEVRLPSIASTMPVDLTARLEEALTFVFGVPIEWALHDVVNEGTSLLTLKRSRQNARRPRLGPPIDLNSEESSNDIERLLDCYLSFLIRTTPPPGKHHDMAVRVSRVLKASSIAIEDEALALCVQLEGLVKQYFPSYCVQERAFLDDVDDALEYIQKWKQSPQLRDRIYKMIGNFKGPNTRTALRRLSDAGILKREHVDAWEALRHSAAHGQQTAESIRAIVSRCNLVHQAMLRLIFVCVEYTGRFTDYTSLGYPLVPGR